MSTKRKPPAKLAHPIVKQSAKAPFQSSINESNTSVSAVSRPVRASPVADAIEISSDSSSNYDDIPDSEEDPSDNEAGNDILLRSSVADQVVRLEAKRYDEDADTEMLSPAQTRDRRDFVEDSDDEAASPTFGELVQNHEVLDVTAALAVQQEPTPSSAVVAQTRILPPPSGSSLGNVLNQALRTDDNDLLESCFNTNDVNTARNTINRMDSRLAGVLISKLATRMHRRPGRAHNLMVWVQWTLVAHGAALAAQPDVMKTLVPLSRVLDERARGLERLLMLKGKLDMLDSQLQLRQMSRKQGRAGRGSGDSADEDDRGDEGVIYVEGEEDEDDGRPAGREPSRGDGDDLDHFPATNGVEDSEDDESGSEGGADGDEDMDVNPVESVDEDDVDHEDVEESGEEDDSDAEAAPPAKVQKTSKAFLRR